MALVNFKASSVNVGNNTLATVGNDQRLIITGTKIFNSSTTADAKITYAIAGVVIFEETISPRESIIMDGQADVVGSGETVVINSNVASVNVLISGDIA